MKSDHPVQAKETFGLSWYVRSRWNILDLIQFIRGNSVATYIFTDIDMTWAESMRCKLAEQGIKTTVTAFLLKAIGIAQHNHPASRSALLPWGQTMTFERIVAGFTVEKFVNGEAAVYLGVIKDPDKKPLDQIQHELKTYANLGIDDIPQLEIEERFNQMPWLLRRIVVILALSVPWIRFRYMPASFGLSSLGKHGPTAIIPPCVNTSTFGIGKVEDRAVVRDGEIVIRPMVTVTLNFDHRLIDGAPAAKFLGEVQELMEGKLAKHIQEMFDGAGNAVHAVTIR